MSRSSGPGFPLTLRCAKCRGVDNGRGYKLRATGRVRPRRPSERSQGIRQIAGIAEYECLECGHRGWSKHGKMQMLLAAIGITAEQVDGARHARGAPRAACAASRG